MKTHILSVLLVSLLASCASYQATPLDPLVVETSRQSRVEKKSNVLIAAKAYSKQECKSYLDRDVIAKGYQPIQLYIQNNSDQSYLFSLNRLDLPCARAEEVASKVHTSTVGRVLGYGVPGVILLWPLIIPAVVDGIKSSEANEALDNDFSSKIAKDQTLFPYSRLNKIIFVPVHAMQSSFNMTLIDQESGQPQTFNVVLS